MKTKNSFRAETLILMLSTLLMTTACSYDTRLSDNDADQVLQGYEFPVTVNAVSQSQTTRSFYNAETMRLSINAGDQLLVSGNHPKAGKFAGKLIWVSGVSFEGLITTEKEFVGTAYNLLEEATCTSAILLPNDYSIYGYLSISGTGCSTSLNSPATTKAFVDTKAHGVEQLSYVYSEKYANGFSLTAANAIMSCTVSGLVPGKAYSFTVTDGTHSPSGEVTTDSSGQATFTVAFVPDGARNYSVRIDDGSEYQDINIGDRIMAGGCIYSIRLKAMKRL